MVKKLVLIDSNIIVYAINISSPKHSSAQNFLQSEIGHLTFSHQNVLESFRVLTHHQFTNPMSSNDALGAIVAIVQNAHLLSPNYSTYYLALELIKKYDISGDNIFDTYLAATALSNDIKTIATDNTKDFKKIIEITTYNPFKD